MAVGTRGDVLRATALTVAVPVAVVVAVMTVAAVSAQDASGWDSLGTMLVGAAVSAVLGVVAAVVTAAVAFTRALPRGHRWQPALAVVLGLVATVAALLVPYARSGPVAALCVLALTGLLPLVVTGHVRRRWVAVVLAVAVVLGGVEAVTQRWDQDRERRAELARFAGALPLTDGTSLDSPLPGGWTHVSTDWPYPGFEQPLRIQWRRAASTPAEADYVLEIHTDRTDCTPLAEAPTCTAIGPGVHGDVTRKVHGYAFVRVGDVEWRVDGSLDDDDASTVLDRLEPADVDVFLRAASRAENS